MQLNYLFYFRRSEETKHPKAKRKTHHRCYSQLRTEKPPRSAHHQNNVISPINQRRQRSRQSLAYFAAPRLRRSSEGRTPRCRPVRSRGAAPRSPARLTRRPALPPGGAGRHSTASHRPAAVARGLPGEGNGGCRQSPHRDPLCPVARVGRGGKTS